MKPKQRDMMTRHHHVLTKRLLGAAIAVGCCVGAAPPAGADPDRAGADADPFAALGCSCRQVAPPDGPALREEIRRGLRDGLSVWVPGLPPPPLPGQAPP